ncbi:DUF1295 domain-containing protein [Pontibacillus yanchengensis]|uniref:DUF1295 domain-containing protein n=2 Tax=Pontibacillus yanchengensis TaxID=462910 RepID=A0ACC7VCF0_9BACI|nr:isoprenylcysteine carboxylmethyltransferase family protein [Pontibacillus yanchengensis]MYL35166.1 DUF1295 domain-containing protein [Pontibacillus yanchengensis]MYL52467.1 DUF1295 domain-containing protein [Pontibacillus yanchengensis]
MSNRRLMPPTYFLMYLLLSNVLHFTIPVMTFISFPYNLLGIVLIIIGIGINVWADQLFKKYETTVKPFERSESLTKEGPFVFSRNPMYLGFLSMLVGASLLLGSLTSLVGPLLFIIIINTVFIRYEEQDLEKTFGEEYMKYKQQVRRWV